MRSVAEHRDHVLSLTCPMPTESVSIEHAAGRVLRRPVTAQVPVPVFDNSAMDGYGVRFEDVRSAAESAPVLLSVSADLPAGSSRRPEVGPMQAVRMMTGAPVPPGVDTIVPVEDTDGGLEQVAIRAVAGVGKHVRRAAEDIAVGAEVVPAGVRLGALEISSIAAVGVPEVEVSRRPRVAVLATGDELVEPGADLAHGQIPESNSYLLAQLAVEAGAEVVHRGRVGDRTSELLADLATLGDVDVVIMSGGVSVGAYDVVKAALLSRGDVDFVRVAMQPGKPQAIGRLGEGPLVFGLPGNPVSSAVSFRVFVRPALESMLGCSEPVREWAVAAVGWTPSPGRQQVIPVTISTDEQGTQVVAPVSAGGSRSHYVGSLARAHGWAIVPAEAAEVRPGDVLELLRR